MITSDKILSGDAMLTLMRGQDHPGLKLENPRQTRDGKFYDTSGAFLVGELERLDQTMHQPLSSISFERDLPLRTDVSLGDEVTSFTQSTFGTPGGAGQGAPLGFKRSVIGKKSTQIPEMEVDIDKVTSPLIPWGEGVAYSLPELESAAQVGRPIDQQKIAALNREFQMQSDAQAYLGYPGNGTFGLINNTTQVTPTNFPATGTNPVGGAASSLWAFKTAAQILTDLATLVFTPWANSGFAVKPNRILLDPNNYNLIRIQPATEAGSKSILQYFLDSYNSDPKEEPLSIKPLKWLTGAGQGGTLLTPGTVNRAISYYRGQGWQESPVRFPFLALARTPIQFDGLWHKMYWWTRMGAVEFVYPETVFFADGN
jgi:hypothetical protein